MPARSMTGGEVGDDPSGSAIVPIVVEDGASTRTYDRSLGVSASTVEAGACVENRSETDADATEEGTATDGLESIEEIGSVTAGGEVTMAVDCVGAAEGSVGGSPARLGHE
jgi:hypothetical protein